MKHLLPLIFFSCVSFSVFSQDLIVTQEQDSINCKITKVKKDNIYFVFKHKQEVRSTLLPISKVKTYKFNFYEKGQVSEENVNIYNNNYQKIRIAINGGYSYLTSKISESVPGDLRNYIRELKSGLNFSSDITYYFSENVGAGLKYSVYKTSNSLNEIYVEDLNGNRTFGLLSDDITVTFIGASFSTRYLNNDKNNAFLTNISLGYMGYSNNAVVIDEFELTGNTLGMSIGLGYDIGISDYLSLGFEISYVTGTLQKYNLNDGFSNRKIELESDEFESLNRLDFSIGLRFSK